MVSEHGWPRAGDGRCSADDDGRDDANSPSSFLRSTPRPERVERLTRRADHVAVRLRGAAGRAPGLLVHVRPASGSATRVGLVVPRHGQSAVARNRLKRRLRAIVRLGGVPRSMDVVLTATARAYSMGYHQLEESVRELLRGLTGKEPG